MDHYAKRLPEVLRRVAAVHCISESLRDEAVAFGLDPAKAHVIRTAVDPALFHPPEPASTNGSAAPEPGDEPRLRLLTVGWLRWEKGSEYALGALRRLLDHGVPATLDIVGSVPEEWRGKLGEDERIAHTIADLGLEGRVRLLGKLPSGEISRMLREADVLVHAAVTEGVPTVIVEAMASGLPVVAAATGGIPETVEDGVEGLLVPPRDPEALAAAVLRLWEDPGLRVRMGEAGRARVRRGMTLDHEHAAWDELYRRVVVA
jgi:glycosyltransferase involved in cell wall biosynthesis